MEGEKESGLYSLESEPDLHHTPLVDDYREHYDHQGVANVDFLVIIGDNIGFVGDKDDHYFMV